MKIAQRARKVSGVQVQRRIAREFLDKEIASVLKAWFIAECVTLN